MLRLAALLPDGDAAHAAADALKLSNADRTRLEQALGGAALTAGLSAKDARLLLYRLGVARFRDKVLLAWAGAPKGTNALPWRMMLRMAETWERPRFALTGLDVMQAGIAEGPDVGRVLAKVEDWWAGGDFTANEAAVREKLKSVIDGL
jgi:poly(A) polymerase